jgi:AraC-like DNA-binding protein
LAEILILQADPWASAILAGALESRYRCRRIAALKEIDTRLPHGGPRGCIVDLFDPAPPLLLTALRRLRRQYPSLALLVAGDFSGREMDLYHLGRVSVDGVIRLEENPTGRRILAVVDEAVAARLAEMVVQAVAQDLPPLAQEAIQWAIESAESRPRVSDLGAALGLRPRTLLRGLRAAGLAPPRTLLLWGRLIQASHLLERPPGTVENVAFRLGYATAGTLRKAPKHHVGCGPTNLQHRGGLAWTLGIFRKKGLRRVGESRKRWTNAGKSRWRTLSRTPGSR